MHFPKNQPGKLLSGCRERPMGYRRCSAKARRERLPSIWHGSFPTASITVAMGAARRVISSLKPLEAASKRSTGMSGSKFRNVPRAGERGRINMKNWATMTTKVKINPKLHRGPGDFWPKPFDWLSHCVPIPPDQEESLPTFSEQKKACQLRAKLLPFQATEPTLPRPRTTVDFAGLSKWLNPAAKSSFSGAP